MRISIVTVGSRGDVQPYVALGRGLAAASHQVKLVTDPIFETFITGVGLEFAPLDASPIRALQDASLGMKNNPLRFNAWIKRQVDPIAPQATRQVLEACRGADLILSSGLAGMFAWPVGQALGTPEVTATLWPYAPTRQYPSQLYPELPAWVPLRGWYNWLSAYAAPAALYGMIYKTINRCRQEVLGIPPLPFHRYANVSLAKVHSINAYSQHVIPRPKEWGDHIHITGYWFLDPDAPWQPPDELAEFLQAGPKPVYIGFGSMLDKDAGQLASLVVDAVEQAGVRAILLGGWADLGGGDLTGGILKVDSVPHHWLFPRLSAVVHHGGMGTTAAGFRAGVPCVIVPFFGDQPFWGRWAHALGISPPPIPRRQLTADKLASAIHRAVSDTAMQVRAAELGCKLRAEDGVLEAVRVVEQLMQHPAALIPS